MPAGQLKVQLGIHIIEIIVAEIILIKDRAKQYIYRASPGGNQKGRFTGLQRPIEGYTGRNTSHPDYPAQLLITSVFHANIQHRAHMITVRCWKASFHQSSILNGMRIKIPYHSLHLATL